MNFKNIGLFFGSFNPIHIGHLAIANYLVEFTPIDQIWFVVSPQNPLKKKDSLLSDIHRLTMVRIAIEFDNRMKASNIEFSLPQPSYTIDTLTYLKEKHPDLNFSIIVGADQIPTFDKWKNYKELMALAKRYVYPRNEIQLDLESILMQNTEIVPAPKIEISASFIRESISQGKDVRYFMHQKVWEYASEMNFYKKIKTKKGS